MECRFEVSEDTVPQGGAPQMIGEVRMCWFFCADEGINHYLSRQPTIELEVFDSSSSLKFGGAEIDMTEVCFACSHVTSSLSSMLDVVLCLCACMHARLYAFGPFD